MLASNSSIIVRYYKGLQYEVFDNELLSEPNGKGFFSYRNTNLLLMNNIGQDNFELFLIHLKKAVDYFNIFLFINIHK